MRFLFGYGSSPFGVIDNPFASSGVGSIPRFDFTEDDGPHANPVSGDVEADPWWRELLGDVIDTAPDIIRAVRGQGPVGDSPQNATVSSNGTKRDWLDYLKEVGENIIGANKRILQAAAEGGVEGASASAAGARKGAEVGANLAMTTNIILIAGVVLVAVIMFKQ